MARPLQVLSLLSRLGALTVTPTNSCRFASRGAGGAWMRQSHERGGRAADRYSDHMSDEECGLEDVEDVEDKLQALVDEGKKRQKTLKYNILRRKMTPKGAPQRELTWEAIEQIRYLKHEQPEEWTIQRLAEGFSVSPDVIQRVLRNKFVPAPERKAKQDAKLMARLSQQALPSGAEPWQDKPKLPGNRTPAVLPSGSREAALIPAAERTLMIRGQGSGSPAKSPAPFSVLPTQFTAGVSRDAPVTRSVEEDIPTYTNPTEEEEEEEEDIDEEEGWDGQVFTEEDLEEFIKMEKPAPVVQVGNDFFDAEGNLLYRI